MTNRNKINWLQILQGWAMLWVVIGHSGPSPTLDDYPAYASQLWNIAYSFHMSLFIMVSGFLFFLTRLDDERWTYWAMMKDKLLRFGIPFLFFTIIALVLKNIFAGSIERGTTISLSEFVNAILYPYNGPMREFWFMATIMWFFVFFPLWKKVIRNKWLSILTLVCLTTFSIRHPHNDFLAVRHVCQYALFFYLGILCASLYKRKPEFIMQCSFIFIALVLGLALYMVGKVWNVPLLTPLGGIAISLSICLFFEQKKSKFFLQF